MGILMTKIEIDKDRILNPGDVVELHYSTPGGKWMKAAEAAIVEYALERREDFMINSIDYLQPGKIIIEVKVLKSNPLVVTVALIIAVIAIPAMALGWMFLKAYLLAQTVAGGISMVSLGVIGVIVALIVYKRAY